VLYQRPEPEIDPGYAHGDPDTGQPGASPAGQDDNDGRETEQDRGDDDEEFQARQAHKASMAALAASGKRPHIGAAVSASVAVSKRWRSRASDAARASPGLPC
jgi:hypothetical protein